MREFFNDPDKIKSCKSLSLTLYAFFQAENKIRIFRKQDLQFGIFIVNLKSKKVLQTFSNPKKFDHFKDIVFKMLQYSSILHPFAQTLVNHL